MSSSATWTTPASRPAVAKPEPVFSALLCSGLAHRCTAPGAERCGHPGVHDRGLSCRCRWGGPTVAESRRWWPRPGGRSRPVPGDRPRPASARPSPACTSAPGGSCRRADGRPSSGSGAWRSRRDPRCSTAGGTPRSRTDRGGPGSRRTGPAGEVPVLAPLAEGPSSRTATCRRVALPALRSPGVPSAPDAHPERPCGRGHDARSGEDADDDQAGGWRRPLTT